LKHRNTQQQQQEQQEQQQQNSEENGEQVETNHISPNFDPTLIGRSAVESRLSNNHIDANDINNKGKSKKRKMSVKEKKEVELWRVVAGIEKEWQRKKRELRFATKNGVLNINYMNLPGLKRKLLKDFFHTIMDAKWRYFMLLFTLSFVIPWILFAAIWYLIVKLRDINCVDNVDDFATAFLFSVETQVTIGYGGRAVTDECPEGVILLIIQTVIGTFVNCALLGVLFAKLSRPKNRGKTIVFSERAVITLRDGRYCFIFRYVDLRERKLLDSNMRLIIIKPRMTVEGMDCPMDMMDMAVTIDYHQVDFTMRLFPIYPISIIHVIDKHSPLFNMTRDKIPYAEFEILAILEGTVPGTGNTTEAVTSFKPREIEWGHRFTPVYIGIKEGHTTNCVDLSTLDETYEEYCTPDYSAKTHRELKQAAKSSSSSSGGSSSSSSSTSSTPKNGAKKSKKEKDVGSESSASVKEDEADSVEVCEVDVITSDGCDVDANSHVEIHIETGEL